MHFRSGGYRKAVDGSAQKGRGPSSVKGVLEDGMRARI